MIYDKGDPMKRSFARPLRCVAMGVCVLVVGGLVAQACNVPVFRYALERWHPDPYRVTVFQRGPLSEETRKLLQPFESSTNAPFNTALRAIDLDAVDSDADRALLATQPSLPELGILVQYPKSLRMEQPIWAGALNDESLAQLATSPLRAELIRRLADGQTAVWLMLECGHAEQDDAMAAMLTDELQKLAQELKLPELTSAPEDNLLSSAPLKISFSLLRVPRGDAAEQVLVEMLLHSESDLKEFDEPMVFPVFGRGRALLPLIGKGISTDNIRGSAEFLVGACSCEIKELNPGFDLLLAADWDELLFQETPPAEVLAARNAVVSGEPELIEIPAGPSSPAPVDKSELQAEPPLTSSRANPSYATGIVLVGLLLAAVVVAVKQFV